MKRVISRSNVEELLLMKPPLPLQNRFAQIAQGVDCLLAQQREAERQAEHLFQTLLHGTFRGGVKEVRLWTVTESTQPSPVLCDPGSFVEYGSLVIAAQRLRRPLEELIAQTPADGLVAGIGRVNGDLFDESRSRCMVLSYDYTVLAGTQGMQNHHKKDRMFELAEEWRLPIVFFTEGGGGRPGGGQRRGNQ